MTVWRIILQSSTRLGIAVLMKNSIFLGFFCGKGRLTYRIRFAILWNLLCSKIAPFRIFKDDVHLFFDGFDVLPPLLHFKTDGFFLHLLKIVEILFLFLIEDCSQCHHFFIQGSVVFEKIVQFCFCQFHLFIISSFLCFFEAMALLMENSLSLFRANVIGKGFSLFLNWGI